MESTRNIRSWENGNLIVSWFVLILIVSGYPSHCAPLEAESLPNCFKAPETVLIECRVLNVKSVYCVDNQTNVISIPRSPENDYGEINCTSPTPIDVSFNGFQLTDSVNTSFVRNAENVFNEATYVFSVSISLLSITSPREVIVSRYNSPNYKMSFFVFRPGKNIFSENLMPPSHSHQQPFVLDYDSKDMVIPCISSHPNVTPTLEPHKEYISYDPTKGFIINRANSAVGRYVCKTKSEATGTSDHDQEVSVTFEVEPKRDAIFYPTEDKVYVFANSKLRLSCKYSKRVTLEGKFRGKVISPTLWASDTAILDIGSEYVDEVLKVDDSGTIHCKDDAKILKTWNIETLDITKNRVLQLNKINESHIICQSSTHPVEEMSLQVVFCQGVTECKLNEFCFEKGADKKSCNNTMKAHPCQVNDGKNINSLCLSLPTNDVNVSQGTLRCTSGNYSYQTNFFRGFDKKLYLDWEAAPLEALIDIFVPNVTMYPHNSYPFGCRTTKFISDGRLQWVIRGKDGSEILLHKNRVQDLYGVYASPQDYSLYTVRESNIRLIYPNDYDIICMVPRWNATAWVRHHKRINVAAKEAPIPEILAGSGAVIAILIGVVAYVVWRLKKAKEAIRNLTEKEVKEFLEGNPEALKNAGDKDAHEVVDSIPYDQQFEIPREKLLIDTENCLGKGAFGTVLKGRVEGISDVVAVKTVNSDCEVSRFKGFLSELKIMIYIGKHQNIVSLIGASTEKIKEKTLYIVVEFCSNGSLESYTRRNKGWFVDQIVNNEVQVGVSAYENFTGSASNSGDLQIITTIDLIRWSYQIARGMEYLAKKKVVHADLAARNVLVDSKGNIKITDFGLSRQLFDYTQYVKKQQEPLPWRWMAIESLQQLRFSSQSDAWAYGVLLWEIFSMGDIPYPGRSWDINFVQQLCNGLRLIKPPFCTESIYNIMLDCWQEMPENRPTFSFIAQYFKTILEGLNAELEATKELQVSSAYSNVLPGYMRAGDLNGVRKSTNLYI